MAYSRTRCSRNGVDWRHRKPVRRRRAGFECSGIVGVLGCGIPQRSGCCAVSVHFLLGSQMPSGRKSRNVEFLNTLKNVFRYGAVSGFAKACGKKTPNMSNYLNGSLKPGDSVLRTSVTHLSEWWVQPLRELDRIQKNLNELPIDPGIYVLFDSASQILYLGKATNLRAEVRQALNRTVPVSIRFAPHLNEKTHPKLKRLATHLSLYAVPSSRLRHNLEALLLRVVANQSHNQNFGHFR